MGLPVFGQWPENPANNLAICTASGEQTVPKIGATSDGGCFVAWYDHRGNNYDVYIQYLDSAGVPQFAQNGLLVSNHAQDTWITDWDLTVDQNDNAILAVNDIRAGGDWDIYGYSIGTDGSFNWGANGKTLSDNTYFEPSPRVLTANDGNIYFAWQQETATSYVINVYKVSPEGQDLWNPARVTLSSEFGLSIPRLAPTNDGGFLLQYLVAQGSGFPTPNHLYIQRFNASGTAQWETAGVGLNTAGGFGFAPLPDLVSDGNNGAISYWYDSRDMENHVYLERISSAGQVQWSRNGVPVSTANELQTSPAIAYIPATGNTFVFYQTSNTGQTASGMSAQLFNAAGQRQWSDNGMVLAGMSTQQQYLLHAYPQPDSTAVVVYLEYMPGSVVNAQLRAIKLDANENMVWGPSAIVMASAASSKGHLAGTLRANGTIVSAWHDDRNGNPDIYLQNINPDGSFGAPPATMNPTIEITAPIDNSVFHLLPFDIEVNVTDFVVAPENSGAGLLQIETIDQTTSAVITNTFLNSVASVQLTGDDLPSGGDYLIRATLTGYDSLPIEPSASDSIHFTYQPPTLAITAPVDSAVFEMAPVTAAFQVTDFPLGLDSGRVIVKLNGEIIDTLYNGAPFDLAWFPVEGRQELVLWLQNPDGTDFEPFTADSVFFYFYTLEVADNDSERPEEFGLEPAFPNPFNPSTTIQYSLAQTGPLTLAVYDLQGRRIIKLQTGVVTAGRHELTLSAGNLASGVYLLRLSTAAGLVASQKIVKLK